MTPTPAASITLTNGCVVRVGDRLPCLGGETIVLLDIEDDPGDTFPLLAIEIAPKSARKTETRWYAVDAIDLAKLAEQQAAQPAGAPLREMVERWRKKADNVRTPMGATEVRSAADDARRDTLEECAAELAAALAGMKEGGRG